MPKILAIESSCDDTSAAIISDGRILSNIISSQKIHRDFGGVVPELASRAHQTNIVPVIDACFSEAGLEKREIDAVAFTIGPGLLGSLLVGGSFAKSFAMALGKPIIAVDHLYAHLAAHFIDDPKPAFPFLCLLVSGGHTQIILMKDEFQYEIIGQSMDDAAGEAFDKGAKILGLDYPGGPLIDKYSLNGNSGAFVFPKPSVPGYNYSFSGLKTSFLYLIRDGLDRDTGFIKNNLNDLCASYQKVIVEYLLDKLHAAAEDLNVKNIGIAGGVAANSYLRSKLLELSKNHKWRIFIPEFEYCMDNAAMVAMAAEFMYGRGDFANLSANPYSRLSVK